jgi:hypothetical protein
LAAHQLFTVAVAVDHVRTQIKLHMGVSVVVATEVRTILIPPTMLQMVVLIPEAEQVVLNVGI